MDLKRIEFLQDTPIDGEAYAVFVDLNTGKAAFAWGAEYPYEDELPTEDIEEGESGISWYEFEAGAIAAMNEALRAHGLEEVSQG